jgi:hypothetical protein
MAAALEHSYRYAAPSACTDGVLALATSDGDLAHPHFFSGWVSQPGQCATSLLVVGRTARSRFFEHGAIRLTDPVVTCHLDTLRFESFSSCCSTYARYDLDLADVDGEVLMPGATNVDFNPPMRAELAKVGDASPMHLQVGADSVAATTERGTVVERKVALPQRWIKGFGEVGVVQRGLEQRLELSGPLAQRLLRSLPKGGGRSAVHIVQAGREARLRHAAVPGSVAVRGTDRLRLLDPLLRHARRLRVFADDEGSSTWVLDMRSGRVHLTLSPEPWRGFSGEGGALAGLASDELTALAERLADDLAWQSRLDPARVGAMAGVDAGRAGDALSVVGSRGRAGFDVSAGAYFHRDLPYDLERVEGLHPRLLAARSLVAAGAVRAAGPGEAYVRGSGDLEYRVRLAGEEAVCACPWWARHAGARGPCKHVLAAKMVLTGDA